MHLTRTGLVVGMVLGLFALTVLPGERALHRSDVIFMYDNPALYEAYGCTVMGWAGRADEQHIRGAHQKGVRQFSCSVGFLTEFRRVIEFDENFIDAACRNFAGEPFIVPWLWDHKHKGKPAYWWCTNSPLYRRYLMNRLQQVIQTKPDGLHIDDYRGTSGSITWLSGGFCRHCMSAFRDYLREHVSPEKLATLGITDLAQFDYRRFLIEQGVKPEDYNHRRAGLPLADEFYTFHIMAANNWVTEYHQQAATMRGRPLTLSVNSGLNNPHALVIAPSLSYFCCEVGHNAAARRCASHPVYIYKLADGLGRPVASTASGHDWAFVHENQVPGLVRSWIAMSYAFGHALMAPHRQWCYTKEKGTHWTDGKTEEYAPLYRFVRANARLLDGYEAVAPVAVVYSSAARRRGKADIETICVALARQNVPFTVVVAGDDWIEKRLNLEHLQAFQAVIIPRSLSLDKEQQAVLEELTAAQKLVSWINEEKSAAQLPRPVLVEGAEDVWAVPRRKNTSSGSVEIDAPLVIHLLNRNYRPESDSMVSQKNFSLSLRHELLTPNQPAEAVLHAPGRPPTGLIAVMDSDAMTLHIPELDLWGLVEVRTGNRGSP